MFIITGTNMLQNRTFVLQTLTITHYINIIYITLQLDGPLYWVTMATCILDRDKWKENRVTLLKRLLILAHARNVMPSGGKRFVGHCCGVF